MNRIAMLRKAEALETQIGLLYEWLSTVLVESPDACAAFFRLSLEEKSHANIVAYQRRTLASDLRGADESGLLDTLGTSIDSLLQAITDFRASTPRPTVDEAVRMAIFLESSAIEKIHGGIIAAACPELASLGNQLGRYDRRHLQNLQDLVVEQERAEGGGYQATRGVPAIAVRRNRPAYDEAGPVSRSRYSTGGAAQCG